MDTVIRELLPQQQPRTIERRDLQYITISKEELASSDSLSPDPWKRDAREKAEKQQQLHIVDLLDKEIQELQVDSISAPLRKEGRIPRTRSDGLTDNRCTHCLPVEAGANGRGKRPPEEADAGVAVPETTAGVQA